MTVESILTPVITEELAKYQLNGQKLRFKTTKKNRIKYTVFCLLGAIVFPPVSTIIALLVYFNLMKKTDPVNTIIAAAKKKPDTPIAQIIAEEIIL